MCMIFNFKEIKGKRSIQASKEVWNRMKMVIVNKSICYDHSDYYVSHQPNLMQSEKGHKVHLSIFIV